MSNVNVVVLDGRLTQDVELKYTQSKTAVANLNFVHNRRVKEGEEYVDKPVFVEVVIWGKRAEAAKSNLVKGSHLVVNGELDMDSWEDSITGKTRSKLKLLAKSLSYTPK